MAQQRTEVKPLVSSMPGAGFQLQTGGSARRRLVKNESDSYKVTGVPGHTHNASAVLSLLCDHTRTRGRDLDITNDFAFAEVNLGADDPGDSEAVPEDAYDRAIERGIGEIAMIPENCHQEIREPMRAIGEVRALVTAADRLKTLTYVEEVGGFVNQDGTAFISDYPDITVDLFHGKGDATRDTAPDVSFGVDGDQKIHFRSNNWSRDENNAGTGTVLEVGTDDPNEPFASVDGEPWTGLVTFSWDAENNLYQSEPFEVLFEALLECAPSVFVPQVGVLGQPGYAASFYEDPVTAEQANTTIEFPSLTTYAAENGQCVFSNTDARATLEARRCAPVQILVHVQDALSNVLDQHEGYVFLTFPFRIPVGGTEVIYGPRLQTSSYWDRLRATTLEVMMDNVADNYRHTIENQANAFYNGDEVDEETAVSMGHPLYRHDRPNHEAVVPVMLYRNQIRGAAWYPADSEFEDTTFFNGYIDSADGERYEHRNVAVAALPATYQGLKGNYEDALATGDQVGADTIMDAIEALFLVGTDDLDRDDAHASFERLLDFPATKPTIALMGEYVLELLQNNGDVQISDGSVVRTFSEAHYNDVVQVRQTAVTGAQLTEAQMQGLYDQAVVAWQVAVAMNAGVAQALLDRDAALANLTAATTAFNDHLATQALTDSEFITRHPSEWLTWHSEGDLVEPKLLGLVVENDQLQPMLDDETISFSRMTSVPIQLVLAQTNNVRHFVPAVTLNAANPATYNRHHVSMFGDTPNGQQPALQAHAGTGHFVRSCLFQLWTDISETNNTHNDRSYTITAPIAKLAALDTVKFSTGQASPPEDVIVMSIDQPKKGLARFESWSKMAFMGNNGFLELFNTYDGADRPLQLPLHGGADDLHADVKVLTPSLIAWHNASSAPTNQFPNISDSVIYLVDCSINFQDSRKIILRFNDVGTANDADRDFPSVCMFDTDDCSPELWSSEDANYSVHLLTRVDNVRFLRRDPDDLPLNSVPDEPKTLIPLSDHFWPRALGYAVPGNVVRVEDYLGSYADFPNRCGGTEYDREVNMNTVSFMFVPQEFQEDWWDGDFDARIAASNAVGPVFQSKIRVSQHLCAPVLNPNRRIGCSAPLNYDSQHLPPELRDFRLELRDVKWDFLPGTQTLENLVMYEFNGGNQKQEVDESLLHLPQFRQYETSAEADGSFELEIFSPYGMPSYMAVYARDPNFSRDAERQPLIKELSIRSNTTMTLSNSILEAREHELYHMTQRNVHPRAEYDRFRYRHRQVVLLSAEDIGMLGISEYQAQKRARYVLSGTTDRAATITALFIFNNRGLLVHGREISVVRV
jgi:hypothetical protein